MKGSEDVGDSWKACYGRKGFKRRRKYAKENLHARGDVDASSDNGTIGSSRSETAQGSANASRASPSENSASDD